MLTRRAFVNLARTTARRYSTAHLSPVQASVADRNNVKPIIHGIATGVPPGTSSESSPARLA